MTCMERGPKRATELSEERSLSSSFYTSDGAVGNIGYLYFDRVTFCSAEFTSRALITGVASISLLITAYTARSIGRFIFLVG